jgi:hypothetical protein
VQNSNPSQPFASSFPFRLDDQMARAYARARERIDRGEVANLNALFAAFGAAPPEVTAEPAAEPAEPRSLFDRIDVGELLRVFREPLEWLLARAERRAEADPLDLAAIERLRAVLQHRIAAPALETPTDAPRLRATDLLIVAGRLVGTIDPATVQRVGLELGSVLANAIGTMLQLDPSLVAHLMNVAASVGRPHIPHPMSPIGPMGSIAPPWSCPHHTCGL